MIDLSLERTVIAFQAKGGVVQLLDQATGTLSIESCYGLPHDLVVQLEKLQGIKCPMATVLNKSEPLFILDATPDFAACQITQLDMLTTYMGVPIEARGHMMGVLSMFCEAGAQLNEADVTLLASVAEHIGIAVESSRLRLQAKQTAVLEERERLARELHDAINQSLYSLIYYVEATRSQADKGNMNLVNEYLQEIDNNARQAVREMRLVLYQLRPLSEWNGLEEAIAQRLEAVEKRVGVRASLENQTKSRLPTLVEKELYRIAQEALNNALQHAQATSVTVRLWSDEDQDFMEITDDGCGFDLSSAHFEGGMGMLNMRERVKKLDGKLTIQSQPNEGTAVCVTIQTNSL
jgi:signal transduction histidine kinase